MIRQAVSPKDAMLVLDSLVDCDRDAVEALFNTGEPCNQALADRLSKDRIGLLSVLNALFDRIDGMGVIAMHLDGKDRLKGFGRFDTMPPTQQAVSPDNAIRILNELVTLDRAALHALVEHRVPCNEDLADHPTAQVAVHDGQANIGLLGVLNALFGTLGEDAGGFAGYGPIAGVYDDEEHLIRFERTFG